MMVFYILTSVVNSPDILNLEEKFQIVLAKSCGWEFVKPAFTCSFIKNVVHASCLLFMTVGPFRGVVVKITRLLHQNFVFLIISF